MLKTTVGQVLVNQLLPEDMRDYGRVLDKKGLGDLLAEVGRRYPEKYRDVSFRLGQLGKEVAYLSGGNSFGLAAITKAKSAIARRKRMQILINGILADNSLSDEERRQQLIKLAQSEQKQEREEIFEESKSEKNPLAIQLMGAGRGSKVSLSSLRGSDWLYQDHRNNIIPVPVLRSYSEGLTPLEYWAGTYGARQSVYATKFATQEGGFFGKQLAQIAHRSVVTALDREKDPDTLIGFPVDADDNDNEGALLASPAGGYPRNTVLTPKILSHIRQQGIKRLLLRSPAVSGAPDGGLYARDAGHREFGQLPVVGEQLGMVSAQSLCLAEGTLVQMADGRQLPIEQIQPGDEVLGCSIEGVVRPTKVLALFDNGERPCIRAVFRRGTGKSAGLNLLEIVATCEHKILSEIVVRMAKYQAKLPYFSPVAVRPLGTEVRQVSTGLDYGDRFCAKLATTFDDTGLIDEPFALLLGLVIGDGSYTGCASSIGFSCYDSKLVDDLSGYLEKLEFGLGRRTDNEYYVKDLTHSNPKFRADGSYYRNRLKELLKNLEMWGQNSKTKVLPATIHNWNNESVAALLAGLLITDGYVITAGGIGFSSSSFQLLYGIRQLLGIRFGIWGSNILGSDKPRPEGHGFYDTCYKFSIHRREDVNLLRELLPIAGVKDGRLDDLLVEWNQRQRNPQGVVRVRGRCSLISREAVGVRRVFDLYVAHPDHLFMLANGLIVSNSEPISQGMLCLREDTLVRMADFSVKPICQIRPGDLVLGADRQGSTLPVRVTRVYANGPKECYETRFNWPMSDKTESLFSTLDHKILALRFVYSCRGEATNRQPKVLPVGTPTRAGSFSAVTTTGFDDSHLEANHVPLALLLGLFLGDGCRVTPDSGVMLSCFDPVLIRDLEHHVAARGLRFHKMPGHPGQYQIAQLVDTPKRNKAGQFVRGYRNPLKKLLHSYEMIGKYAHEKHIPDDHLSWSRDSLTDLVLGLWATDGSVHVSKQRGRNHPRLSFGSTSEKMLRQLQFLLRWRFGVHSTGPYPHTKNRKRALYSITISSIQMVQRFAALFPDLPGVKSRLLKRVLEEYQPKGPSKSGHGLLRQHQEYAGEFNTYDLEVDHPDHLFVLANGLIVSNSTKHGGGVAGESKTVSGFDYLNSLVQVPKTFKGGAAHATVDGTVQQIAQAPAGGYYVTINDQQHYVGTGFSPRVKIGDKIEAGDVISDGIPNPAMATRYKGIGEGRRYFIQAFVNAMRDANMRVNRRNVETLSRGLINHVRLTEEMGDFIPDDIVPYSSLEHSYRPREGFRSVAPREAVGKYLERPYLHYTIGTKVRPSMLPEFTQFGVDKVDVHDKEPPFEPEMIRGMASLQHDPDWQTRMFGSGLKGSLLDAVHRGGTSEQAGTSFVPSRAKAVDFGKMGPIVTPKRNLGY